MCQFILIERITLLQVGLISPLIITLGWAIPNLAASRKKSLSIKMMGLFMLNMFMFFLATISFYFASYRVFLFFDPLFMFTLIAIFPILYLYLKSVINAGEKSKLTDLYHFIPSLLFMLCASGIYLFVMSPDDKYYYVQECLMQVCSGREGVQFIALLNLGNKIFFTLQAVIYLILFAMLIKGHSRRLMDHYSNLERLKIRWAYLFFGIYAISVLTGLPLLFGGHRSFHEHNSFLIGSFLILSVVLYLVAWIDSSQLLGAVSRILPEQEIGYPYIDISVLKEKLISYFREDKPYLNADLKLEDLQNVLNTNRTYISQLINKEFSTNFCMFVNRYRVNEAKNLLGQKENLNYSNEYLGKLAGFGTYHSFIQAFRYFEDTTPAKYRKSRVQSFESAEV